MKNIVFITALCCLTLAGCQKEQLSTQKALETQVAPTKGGGFASTTNQMVVQYDSTLTEAQKQAMRDAYGVSNYKQCPCADPTLEMWIFDRGTGASGLDLEEKVIAAKEDSDLEGADFNPIFDHGGQKLSAPFGAADSAFAMSKMVADNTNVTIAVLDTGVDYNYFGFDDAFLYNNQENADQCDANGYNDYYGWDFVNQDNDPFDDYGHGTIISSLIYEVLKDQNVSFQLLPIKAFDANGSGNYFDILCGFKYALNNKDVDVINMSFGWYWQDYEIFSRFMYESNEEVIITTSAGNSTVDTDETPHYPSVYPNENLIASAALGSAFGGVNLAQFSNYGIQTVDLAGPGEDIPFYIDPNEFINVSGTSYANAYMSAHAGVTFEESYTIAQHVDQMVAQAIPHPNLFLIKYSAYVYY
ncbi:MAG: S8 family serine peptidase [Gilvibacter sp.]